HLPLRSFHQPSPGEGTEYDRYDLSRRIASAITALADPQTGISPSHIGHPGSTDMAFLYDKAVDAMVLEASGFSDRARKVLDYFASRLRIPTEQIIRDSDANGIDGILKLYPSVDKPRAVSLTNAFDIRSLEPEGQARFEYWTSPGPMAFLVMAFLQVDPARFRDTAIRAGEALLAMQGPDGGITDGDRGFDDVHTEPHMDTLAAFMMLFQVTGQERWKTAAEAAWAWFEKNVFVPEAGIIYQGMGRFEPRKIFATDAYSWTMASPLADRIPLTALEALTDRMLRLGVSRVTVDLPGGKSETLTLIDFTDAGDPKVASDRGGFHPMGSVEWIGGVILSLQKNAVRFWQAGDEADRAKARHMKALAEYFTAEAVRAFYSLDGLDGLLSFYATGQWVPTGHGWRTPYFYVKDPQGGTVLTGGSTIGAWPVLPLRRRNPFVLQDDYGSVYDAIPLDGEDHRAMLAYVSEIIGERAFVENIPRGMSPEADEAPEAWRHNEKMFQAFNSGDYYSAILWARKVVDNREWVRLARAEQERKDREVGGLVDYPWGTPVTQAREAQRRVERYPLLNEVGAAMWGLAASNYRLGNEPEAKAWIRTVIEAVPCHQIFAPSGPGYWNALVSWENNPGATVLDADMGRLYRQVLQEMGRADGAPALRP
ncbi:MAG: hypothetical protein GX606_04195, partial [Elusimicrobia bacterium]|nr:hypothetical protein [Elusimicrobiota bacterium]